MARSTASSAIEAIQRQVRRVRRRQNFRELQRACYLLTAVGTGAGAALVLLALTASPHLFTRSATTVAAVTLGAALVIVRDARRRWLGGARAALWIDRQGGLSGRLATLVEVIARRQDEMPLLPLLVEQNVARLALWRSERLVPRAIPRAPLAAAASGFLFLGLVVALAPRLRPSTPRVVPGEVSAPALDGVDLSDDGVGVAPLDADGAETAASPEVASDERSAAGRLQERIRHALWGEPTGESPLSVAGTHPREEAAGDGSEDTAADGALEPAPSPAELASRERGAGSDAHEAAHPTPGVEEGAHGLLEEPRDGDDETRGPGGAAAGAGSEPDPHLFGPPSGGAGGTSQRFALSLATRVHAGRGGPGEAADPPPAAAAAAPADLAAGQRAEAAVPRMPVPPAYESLVRRHFGREGLR